MRGVQGKAIIWLPLLLTSMEGKRMATTQIGRGGAEKGREERKEEGLLGPGGGLSSSETPLHFPPQAEFKKCVTSMTVGLNYKYD